MQLTATDATAPVQLPEWAKNLPRRAQPAAIARARGINKSTMSRYLKNHEELKGKDGLVDVVAFDQHYATNAAVLKSAIAATVAEPELPMPERVDTSGDGAIVAAQRRRQEEIKTKNMEMDLAEREGSIVPIEKVLSSRAAIAVTLRDKLLNVDIKLGEKIVSAVREGAEPMRVVGMIVDDHRLILNDIITALEREIVKHDTEDTADAG
jgi:hypothetical protein